jgi:hypothetical protein
MTSAEVSLVLHRNWFVFGIAAAFVVLGGAVAAKR